jgi:hypothetical protein
MANAGPYQRLAKSPAKSLSLSEAQYDRIVASRPDLVIRQGDDASVVSRVFRDYLEVHYGFADFTAFRERFAELFNFSIRTVDKAEAPRGIRLGFRDHPNRKVAEPVFWALALDEGPEWVEMQWIAVPEQDEPADAIEGGYKVREATDADRDAIAALDGEASGQPPLTPAGVAGIYEDARWLRVIEDGSGAIVGYLSLRTEPGGWGVIDQAALKPDLAESLRGPVFRWACAFLRSNGSRRIRRRIYTSNATELALVRDMGFTPGDAGFDYTRPVDPDEVKSKIEERMSHGTYIRYGNWR